MVKKTSWVQIVVGLVVVIGGIVAVGWLIRAIGLLFLDYISRSKPEIGAAIIAASGTVLVSVLSVLLARWAERCKELAQRRRELEQEIRQQYLPVYQELVEFLFKLLQSSRSGTPVSEDEMNQFFIQFTQKILILGNIGLSNISVIFVIQSLQRQVNRKAMICYFH